MSEHSDPELAHRQALEWAYSIQARYAEKVAADLVRVSNGFGNTVDPRHLSHMADVRDKMFALGFPDIEPPNLPATPTHEYDDVWCRELLKQAYERVERALQPAEKIKLEKMILSSIPSGQTTAFCAKNTWDDYSFIFIDAELLTFCHLAGKILSRCLIGLLDERGQLTNLESRRVLEPAKSREVRARAIDLFRATVIVGAARGAVPWLPEPKYLPLAMYITCCMETFIVAHEVGHMLADHFVRAERYEAEVTEGIGGALAFRHEDEFEADEIGMLLTVGAASPQEKCYSYSQARALYAPETHRNSRCIGTCSKKTSIGSAVDPSRS